MQFNLGSDSQVISTRWVEELAIEEINMDTSGVMNLNAHLSPEYYLEESSIELMNKIRDRFEIYLNKFNECRGEILSHIKIFKIANSVNDFLLFRNSLKLVFARKSSDTITVGFISSMNGTFAARTNNSPLVPNQIHTIRGSVGAFGKVYWMFENEPVEVDALVRHYLTEFIRLSA